MNKLHPNNLCIYNALVNLRNKKSFKPIIFNFFLKKKTIFQFFELEEIYSSQSGKPEFSFLKTFSRILLCLSFFFP